MKKDNNKENTNIFVRIGRWFPKAGKAIAKYFKDVVGEVKKLSWPTKKELMNYTPCGFRFCCNDGYHHVGSRPRLQ